MLTYLYGLQFEILLPPEPMPGQLVSRLLSVAELASNYARKKTLICGGSGINVEKRTSGWEKGDTPTC